MTNRSETFKFRLSTDERRAIADLAIRLQRSQSDAVRFVVLEAAMQLTQLGSAPTSLADTPQVRDIHDKD